MEINYIGPGSVMNNGLTGMQRGSDQVNEASSEIAREPVRRQEREQVLEAQQAVQRQDDRVAVRATEETGISPDAITRELINLNEGEMVFRANARSIEAAQSTFDSLMTIRPQSTEMR